MLNLKLLNAVNEKTGKHFKKLTAIDLRQQVVAGMNYFVKVRKFFFLKICLN
jgi:hypothetical protein